MEIFPLLFGAVSGQLLNMGIEEWKGSPSGRDEKESKRNKCHFEKRKIYRMKINLYPIRRGGSPLNLKSPIVGMKRNPKEIKERSAVSGQLIREK